MKKRVSQAAVTMNIYTQLAATDPKSPLRLWRSTMSKPEWSLTWAPDILDEIVFAHINQKNNITLQPSSKRLLAYGSTNQLAARGQFQSTISFQNRQCSTLFHVLEGDHGSLLSCKTATALGIVNLQVSHIRDHSLPQERLLMKYPTLFQGIGKLRGVEVKLHIDERVNPVAQQPRRIPFHICQKVEAELHELEKRV